MGKDARVAGRLPWWQTESCPSWCEASHRDYDEPADREHSGYLASINLALAPGGSGRVTHPMDFAPPTADVSLQQGQRETAPRVSLEIPATRFDMTAAEAREFGELLCRAADMAGGDR